MTSSSRAFIQHTSLSSDQRASYRATSFAIRSARSLKPQAGVRNSDLARLLQAHNATTAAVVTAYNPAGRKLSAAQNKTRHAALAAAIKKLKLATLPAERKPNDSGDACDEGYLVLNISGAQAEALLTEFDQHALLWCNQTSAPEIMLHPLVRQQG